MRDGPLHVLLAPDSFGGTLGAAEVARALAAGWRRVAPQDHLELLPLSDGGPGFVEVLGHALGGELAPVIVEDPFGRPVAAQVLVRAKTAYIESAQACGLHLVRPAERDPLRAWTAGVGDLLLAALGLGAEEIVIGLGGSATNDGGAGMLQRLGLGLLDTAGRALEPRARSLRRLDHLAPSPGWRPDAALLAATDVDSPLGGEHGATAMFARQKGATETALAELEAGLSRLVAVVSHELPDAGGLEDLPGAGAAGGLGYGILLLGGRVCSGIGLVLEAVGFEARVAGADLVVTGEGSFDRQSLRGKVVAGVARAARSAGVTCVVTAGRVSVTPEDCERSGISAAYSLEEEAGSREASLSEPDRFLDRLATRVAADVHHFSAGP